MVAAVLGCRYRPKTAVELGLRRKEKQSLVMRENQCLDTVLNCVRDFMGHVSGFRSIGRNSHQLSRQQ